MTTSIHLRVTTIQFSRSMTTVSRIISSRSRYDLFDTSPCCIPNALRVSLTNRAERRKRRTKRRKTVDMKLLKSVDELESPEIPRGSEVGPSTNPHDFEGDGGKILDSYLLKSSYIFTPSIPVISRVFPFFRITPCNFL